MAILSKQQAINSSIQYLSEYPNGYNLTVNAITNNHEKFNEDLRSLSHFLNDFCYGAKYKRRKKRLKIIAGIEYGILHGGLHAHIVITYCPEMKRTYEEINMFIRKKWYALIEAKGSIFGTLVKFEKLKNLDGSVIYALKNSNHYMNKETIVTLL